MTENLSAFLVFIGLAYQSAVITIPAFKIPKIPLKDNLSHIFIYWLLTFGLLVTFFNLTFQIQTFFFNQSPNTPVIKILNVILLNLSYFISSHFLNSDMPDKSMGKYFQVLVSVRYTVFIYLALSLITSYLFK